MTRRWQPKYKCRCRKCGWTGRRTGTCMHYPCPRCWDYLRGLSAQRKLNHIGAIGGEYSTVEVVAE